MQPEDTVQRSVLPVPDRERFAKNATRHHASLTSVFQQRVYWTFGPPHYGVQMFSVIYGTNGENRA
jgi:hypothetical protein